MRRKLKLERRDPNAPEFKIPFVKPVNPAAQGGGGNEIEDGGFIAVKEFRGHATSYVEKIYAEVSTEYLLGTNEGISLFLLEVQGEETADYEADSKHPDDAFFEYMSSPFSGAQVFEDYEIYNSYDHPISNYYISSSHNTYLTGNQLYGHSSTDGYENVLRRGCRCVEIDVWDGEDTSDSSSDEEERREAEARKKKASNTISSSKEPVHAEVLRRPTPWRSHPQVEPVVLHGYTATREVPFRRVCETIRDNAFKASDLPLIVSLEVHTSHEQQGIMVEIMQECFKGMLVDADSTSPDWAKNAACDVLPAPGQLLKKILIKVKYSSPQAEPPESPARVPERLAKGNLSPPGAGSKSNATSLDSSEDETRKVQTQNKPANSKPSKIIDSLSAMGIYTRSCHFKNFQQPEAKVPTHVFSLSEGGLAEVHQTDPQGLFEHNKNFFMRAYPKGTRISSSNLDPLLFWRMGVQMVALNWQRWDAAMMLNEAMFHSTGGWQLKPPQFRSESLVRTASQVPKPRVDASIKIEFFCGHDLPVPADTSPSKFKPFVKVELHIEPPSLADIKDDSKATRAKDGEYKQSTHHAHGIEPDFKRQTLHFNKLPPYMPELSFIRFKVMHEAGLLGRDDLAAWACIRLDRLGRGYRILHLYDDKGIQTSGFILLRITYEWNRDHQVGAQIQQQISGEQNRLQRTLSKVKDKVMGDSSKGKGKEPQGIDQLTLS